MMKIQTTQKDNGKVILDVTGWGRNASKEDQSRMVLQHIFRTYDTIEKPDGTFSNVDERTIEMYERGGNVCAAVFMIS